MKEEPNEGRALMKEEPNEESGLTPSAAVTHGGHKATSPTELSVYSSQRSSQLHIY